MESLLAALDEEKKKVVSRRNAVAVAHSMRGGAGAGKHKNKGDFERGKARYPKHKGKVQEALESGTFLMEAMKSACEDACDALKAAVAKETLSKEDEQEIVVDAYNGKKSMTLVIRILRPGEFSVKAPGMDTVVKGDFDTLKGKMMTFLGEKGYYPTNIYYGEEQIWEA